MSKRNQGFIDWIADVSISSILLHPVMLLSVMAAILIMGATVLWNQYQDQLLPQIVALATPDRLSVNEQPDYILPDIKNSAIEESSLDEIPISDRQAVVDVANAFSNQPWVKDVVKVRKSSAQIDVQVDFRRPIAVVEYGENQLMPIDDEGVILDPAEMKPDSYDGRMRISLQSPSPGPLNPGQPWPDYRIIQAASIASEIDQFHQKFEFVRIVNFSEHRHDEQLQYPFELWTRRGADAIRVVWGNPEARRLEGEATTVEKIEALKKFIQQFGELDRQVNRGFLDVRRGQPEFIPDTRSASRSDSGDADGQNRQN